MEDDYKNTILESVSAIETTPKIHIYKARASFFARRDDRKYRERYRDRINSFIDSLNNIFGTSPISISYLTTNPNTKKRAAVSEPLTDVLVKTCLLDTLSFYLYNKYENAYVLKSGFATKPLQHHVQQTSNIIAELEKKRTTIWIRDYKNDKNFLEEYHTFDAELFCPIFYPVPDNSKNILIGFLAVGKNFLKNVDDFYLMTWNFIAASIAIKLMYVVNYVKLEATKGLKDHFECLGYDGYRFDKAIERNASMIKNLETYKNINLNLKKILPLQYGFKEAWKIFELFSQT